MGLCGVRVEQLARGGWWCASSLPAFAFSCLVAHMIADFLDEEEARCLMDLCVGSEDALPGTVRSAQRNLTFVAELAGAGD